MKIFDNEKLGSKAPTILAVMGVVGLVTTVIFAIDATVKSTKAVKKLEEKDPEVKPSTKEVVKTVAPYYIPTVIMGGMAAACILSSNDLNAKQTAMYAGAFSLAEATSEVYRRRVVDALGKEKEAEIREETDKEVEEKHPNINREVIFTGRDTTLCQDGITKRYFRMDPGKFEGIENRLNKRLISEMYISLNELFYELGLEPTENGDSLGWNVDGGLIEFELTPRLTEDNEVYILVSYNIAPRYGYGDLH